MMFTELFILSLVVPALFGLLYCDTASLIGQTDILMYQACQLLSGDAHNMFAHVRSVAKQLTCNVYYLQPTTFHDPLVLALHSAPLCMHSSSSKGKQEKGGERHAM